MVHLCGVMVELKLASQPDSPVRREPTRRLASPRGGRIHRCLRNYHRLLAMRVVVEGVADRSPTIAALRLSVTTCRGNRLGKLFERDVAISSLSQPRSDRSTPRSLAFRN